MKKIRWGVLSTANIGLEKVIPAAGWVPWWWRYWTLL